MERWRRLCAVLGALAAHVLNIYFTGSLPVRASWLWILDLPTGAHFRCKNKNTLGCMPMQGAIVSGATPPPGACDENETTPCCKDSDFDCEVEAAAGYNCDLADSNITITCRKGGNVFQPDDKAFNCTNRGSRADASLFWSAVPSCTLNQALVDEPEGGVYVKTYQPSTLLNTTVTTTSTIDLSAWNFTNVTNASNTNSSVNLSNTGIAQDDEEEYTGPPAGSLLAFSLTTVALFFAFYYCYSTGKRPEKTDMYPEPDEEQPFNAAFLAGNEAREPQIRVTAPEENALGSTAESFTLSGNWKEKLKRAKSPMSSPRVSEPLQRSISEQLRKEEKASDPDMASTTHTNQTIRDTMATIYDEDDVQDMARDAHHVLDHGELRVNDFSARTHSDEQDDEGSEASLAPVVDTTTLPAAPEDTSTLVDTTIRSPLEKTPPLDDITLLSPVEQTPPAVSVTLNIPENQASVADTGPCGDSAPVEDDDYEA